VWGAIPYRHNDGGQHTDGYPDAHKHTHTHTVSYRHPHQHGHSYRDILRHADVDHGAYGDAHQHLHGHPDAGPYAHSDAHTLQASAVAVSGRMSSQKMAWNLGAQIDAQGMRHYDGGALAVISALRAWTGAMARSRPDVLCIGYCGSYARGDWGFGSDLDVVIILSHPLDAGERIAMRDDMALPVPVDWLVYTSDEGQALGDGPRATRVLRPETVWVYVRDEHET
jgi:uncharacterized protein